VSKVAIMPQEMEEKNLLVRNGSSIKSIDPRVSVGQGVIWNYST